MKHAFHQAIRDTLSDIASPVSSWAWDQACGGSQRISLYRDDNCRRESNYVWVDGVLIRDAKVRLILEIEEAGNNGFAPLRITGKFSASALCRYFIPANGAPIPFHDKVCFVQILNNEWLPPLTRKHGQYESIQHDISEQFLPAGMISEYRLLAGRPEELLRGREQDQELRRLISSVLER